ncbi:MAG: hypothetical protein ACM32O_05035 [Clostridia bacterium]
MFRLRTCAAILMTVLTVFSVSFGYAQGVKVNLTENELELNYKWYQEVLAVIDEYQKEHMLKYEVLVKMYGETAEVKAFNNRVRDNVSAFSYAAARLYSEMFLGMHRTDQEVEKKSDEYIKLYQQGKVHYNTTNKKTIIAMDAAIVYKYPIEASKYEATSLPYGLEIVNRGFVPGWILEHFTSGETGFISNKSVTTYDAIQPRTIRVKVEKAYLVSIPAANAKTRASLGKDVQLTALGENGTYFFVEAIDSYGTLLRGFISKTVAW